VDPGTRRFFRNATILWCVVPLIAFIAAPPVGPFCLPAEPEIYWYKALALGAVLPGLLLLGHHLKDRARTG
jgi:hypothetical protein